MIDYSIDRALGGFLRAMPNGEHLYRCPKCGDKSGHLYVNYRKNMFICHKCSSMRGRDLNVLCKMLGISKKFSPSLDLSMEHIKSRLEVNETVVVDKTSELPAGFRPLLQHKDSSAYRYLSQRGIGDEEIEFYDIGICEGDCFSRIYFPDFKEGQLWFWTSRTYLEYDTSHRYLFSEGTTKSRRIYNYYRALSSGGTWFVAEGPLSAIALGPTGVATFGKDFSSEQVDMLVRSEKKLVIVYDSDAYKDTFRLCKQLRSRGCTPEYVLLGEMGLKKSDSLILRNSGLLKESLDKRKVYNDEDELLYRLGD